jgi:hypothetical protein
MLACRRRRPFGRRCGAALIAALVIGAGAGPEPASALELCQLLNTCAKTGTTTTPPPAPDPGGRENPDQAIPAPGKAFGFNSGLTLSGLASATEELDDVQRAGGRYLRLSIGWRYLQPTASDPPVPAPYAGSTVARLDDLYDRAAARGIKLIIIPGAAPLWATRYASCSLTDTTCQRAQKDYKGTVWANRFSPDPPHFPAFRAFVGAVKRRWPLVLIEAWNEPNLYYQTNNPAWTSSTPEEFAGIQCAAHAGSKDVNTEPVLSAGFADTKYTAYVGALYAAGAKNCWDIANVHVYPGPGQYGADTALARTMKNVRDLRAGYGDTDPLWITETGVTTTGDTDDAGQADALRRLYNRLVTMPDVAGVLVHTLRERVGGSTSDPETGFGLQRADGTPKAAYCQLARMAGSIVGGCPA